MPGSDARLARSPTTRLQEPRMISTAAIRAPLCALLFAVAGQAAASTTLTYTSPAGEPLGQGVGTRTLRGSDEEYAFAQYDLLMVELRQGSESFSIQLPAPAGQSLREGNFLNAEHAAHATGISPGLEILSHGGICDKVWGSFKIRQLELDGYGGINKLEATFVHRCGSATAPALTGTLTVNTGPKYFSYSKDAGYPFHTSAPARTYFGDTSTMHLAGGLSAFTYGVSGLRDNWYFAFSPPTGKKFAKGTYALRNAADATAAG